MTTPDLLTARTAAGLDRTEAARRLGVDQSTLWRWEVGKSRPSRHVLAALLAIYRDAVFARIGAALDGAS